MPRAALIFNILLTNSFLLKLARVSFFCLQTKISNFNENLKVNNETSNLVMTHKEHRSVTAVDKNKEGWGRCSMEGTLTDDLIINS